MKISDVKNILNQYSDSQLVFIKIGCGTAHRINDCVIEGAKFNPDLFEVRGIERDEQTGAPVLLLEATK